MYAKFSVLTVAALATLVAAKGGDKNNHIRIEVGKGGLVFNPNSVTAAIGDVVEFHFYPKNHSVAQGAFDSPCSSGSVTNGFFSGYMPAASSEATSFFQVNIADTNPIWFYCSQGTHCASGMVGVINPPASGNSLTTYIAEAGKSTKVTTPAQVQGGSLVRNDESTTTTGEDHSATKTEDNHSTTTGEDHSSTKTEDNHSGSTTTEDHTSTKTEDHSTSTVTGTGATASTTSTGAGTTSTGAAAASSSKTGTSSSSSSSATPSTVTTNTAQSSFSISWVGMVAVELALGGLALLMY